MFRRAWSWLQSFFRAGDVGMCPDSGQINASEGGDVNRSKANKIRFVQRGRWRSHVVIRHTLISKGDAFQKELESHLDPMQVTEIFLTVTGVEFIPNAIGKFVNLKKLVLDDNAITELPWSLIYLKRLEMLYLSNNLIKELPIIIGHLSSLKELYLTNNYLTYLPTCLLNLTSLHVLDVTFNEGLASPPLSLCNNQKTIFQELHKRNGRWDKFAGSTPWFQEEVDTRSSVGFRNLRFVKTLLETCIDFILECDLDYLTPRNVPPRLKNFLVDHSQLKLARIHVAKCSSCNSYFSSEMSFRNHTCKPTNAKSSNLSLSVRQ